MFELGPVIFFTPWVTWWGWKRLQTGDWMTFVAVISAWLALDCPYSFPSNMIATLCGLPNTAMDLDYAIDNHVDRTASKERKLFRAAGIASLALMVFGVV